MYSKMFLKKVYISYCSFVKVLKSYRILKYECIFGEGVYMNKLYHCIMYNCIISLVYISLVFMYARTILHLIFCVKKRLWNICVILIVFTLTLLDTKMFGKVIRYVCRIHKHIVTILFSCNSVKCTMYMFAKWMCIFFLCK